jgi:hypothetical protein
MRLVKLTAKEGFEVWVNREQVECVHPNEKIIGECILRFAGGHGVIILKGSAQEVVDELRSAV